MNKQNIILDEIKNKISKFAKEKLGYTENDLNGSPKIFDAFNVKKLPNSSNSGDYVNSPLATLGDAVAGLLLCEKLYTDKRKSEITAKKKSLQNDIFFNVAIRLGLPFYLHDGERYGPQSPHNEFNKDYGTLFEAVLGAIYIDLKLEKTQKIWQEVFLPLIGE